MTNDELKGNLMQNLEDLYELSPMQQGMLFHTLYAPESEVYFEQLLCILSGKLNFPAFQQAWQQVVARHSVLRSSFYWEEIEKPLQMVSKQVDLPWEELDWGHFTLDEQQKHLEDFLKGDRQKGFDLSQTPLMRFTIIQLREQTYQFIWSHHHILFDGWSMQIILKEVFALYEANQRGEHLRLQHVRPYREYIQWLQQQDIEQAKKFWQKTLQWFENPTSLAVNKGLKTYKEQRFQLPQTVMEKLQSAARQHHLTLNNLVQGAYALLISRYSGENDVVFGATVSGRPATLEQVDSIVGLLINTLPIRVQVSGKTELLPWLKQLQTQALEQEQYAYCSLAEIQKMSDIPPGIPLFESILVFENYPLDSAKQENQKTLEISHVSCFERTNYPLTLVINPGSEFSGRIIYDTSCFDEQAIDRMIGHFQTLLTGMVGNIQQQISQLSLLSAAEQSQLLLPENNQKIDDIHYKCIHTLFEEQVEKNPDAVAVVYEKQHLTYRELNNRANQLAHYLQSLGVKPEVLVGICVDRSLEMVIGLLGILKAGGAYVPLDPTYPVERLKFMLQDAQVPVLLTQQHLVEQLPPTNMHLICLDDWDAIARHKTANPVNSTTPENLIYIIYTSGSTGQPKGAMNTHQGVSNRLWWMQQTYQLTLQDRVLQKTPFSFDVSVWEFFWTLLYGAGLVIAKPEAHKDSRYLVDLIIQQQITIVHFVPSMLQVFLKEIRVEECESLRLVICSGEALPKSLQQNFFTRFSSTKLHNLYGPTEAAIDVTFWACQADSPYNTVPIGRPITNIQIYILDQNNQPVPIGVPGELHIGGVGVARGYLNRPELTREKFIYNPFNQAEGSRLYKTGDLARYLDDGNIEYLGRIDHQVKIRGFRIELGEIEAALNQHPAVGETVVIACEDQPGDKRLVAYIIPDKQQAFTIRQLLRLEQRGQLSNQLRYELPNGMTIVHLNQTETDFVYQEIFVEQSYLRHGITLKDGDRIFDVGANIGLFSLFVAQYCQNLVIYAFEPIPPVFEVLRLNSELYGLNVHLYECGLSSEVKTDDFTYYPHVSVISGRFADEIQERETIKSFLLNETANKQNQIELSNQEIDELLTERLTNQRFTCKLNTISHVIQEHGITQIDLLKIDAEKSELEVLAGIQEKDWPKIKQIVVEVHDIDGQLEQVTSLLKRHGFDFAIEQDALLKHTSLYNIYAVRSQPQQVTTQFTTSSNNWTSPHLLINEVRRYIAEKLPDYMLPTAFVLLDAFPLTPNGKLDRRALPAPDTSQRNLEVDYVAPRTSTEQELATIWAEVLRLKQVGIYDNFFKLGGHSLLAIQVISRLREAFCLNFPLRYLFENPTIAKLSQKVIEQQIEQAENEALAEILGEVDGLSEAEVTRQLLF